MIIKLDQTYSFARQKEEVATKPLNYSDRVKLDRFVILALFILSIIGAVVFS